MKKGSMSWWIVVCVVLGAVEAVTEAAFEHITGWEISDMVSGIIGAAVIGVLVGLIGFRDEKADEER